MRTLVYEIESQINDRPITYSSDDLNEPTAMAPSEILLGYKLNTLHEPVADPDPDYTNPLILSALHKRYARLRTHFANRWHTEYLLALSERQSTSKNRSSPKPKEGDIVLIHEDVTPRMHWKLGRITQLQPSRDGHVRAALVKTGDSEISRPIVKLYQIEIFQH